ncbi:probable methionyl-tRNA synthetase [Lecanosticta acicola]|uniref:Probable methionine--tRNA ligase, mitochondrial n=1 Tax=Lecanosticta acicola TaxID=111012 RepID=A0AAI9EAR5_9PEZI|nr:probable methionyl-tRNA synthetase [Lecanosticta acicola]
MRRVQHVLTPLQSLIARRWRPEWICQSCRQTRPAPNWTRASSTTTTTTTTEIEKPYYVTTPIFYVNAAPHVGHMYTMILADVLKRWQVLKGRKAVLLTGTDEHGMKIQRAAAKAGVEPKEFCDKGAEVFKSLGAQVDLSNEVFIRTTDQKHREGVEYAWQMLEERGYIYERKHEGWYSVSDETFYPNSQVHLKLDPRTGRKIMASIETDKEVEWTSEKNYHFRLSAFKDRLLEFYAQNPEYVVPQERMRALVKEVEAGLEDLSISRPAERLDWGVRVPTDSSQTIYVWLDALLNYATASGYPWPPGKESAGGWPADVQVIGKDIIRFHCIYWPAFLMALDLPLHKQVLTHAHWTLGREKMAKSTGNVVNPFWALERFGIDVMRWYLIHDGGIRDDADYDNNFIVERYKKGLQGGLGNAIGRIMKGKGWDVKRAVRRYAHPNEADKSKTSLSAAFKDNGMGGWYGQIRACPGKIERHMQELHPNRALQAIMNSVRETNGQLQHWSPWTLVQKLRSAMADTTGQELRQLDEEENTQGGEAVELLEAQIDRIIYLAAEQLRLVGIMLQPFMPSAAKRQLDMMGVDPERRSFEWAVLGKDDSYGVPLVSLDEGGLFMSLTSEF